MKKCFRNMNGLCICSIVLRNICLILLVGIIIIGIRALYGDFDLSQMHILDIIIHYLYFICVLGYLCINSRLIYLYVKEYKKKTQNTVDENQPEVNQLIYNIIILAICLGGCGIIMWREDGNKVVNWIFLQYGLIAWCIVIYVGEIIAKHICFDYKNHVSNESKIREDSLYIPKLLEKIEDDKLKNYIAHALYTYAVRARFYKYGYYICSITALVAPTIVVILNSGFGESVLTKLGVSIFSGIATVASGMLGIVKFKESWTRYRYHCELLKGEVAAYINKQGPYENADKIKQTFYEHVNKIFNDEVCDWKKLRQENNS